MAAAFAQRGERIKELEAQLAAQPKALPSIPEVRHLPRAQPAA
jgi:hypothetical protein